MGDRREIDEKTQQMIVFLTDGQPSAGETYGPKIKENVKKANAETQIPIYGLALGDGADFDLIKDISDQSNGFAERIYESGNSFEQLEDFYNKISDPKLKDVSFEYIVNGKRIVPENLTTSTINQVFGSNEYSVVGSLPEDEEINEIEVILKGKDQVGYFSEIIHLRPCILPIFPLPSPKPLPDQIVPRQPSSKPLPDQIVPFPILPKRCFPIIAPQPIWEQSPTESFMERLWAYKRINFLSDDKKNCSRGIDNTLNDTENVTETNEEKNEVTEVEESEKNECEDEAIRLALKYNFVTDLTSLVIEENDDYIRKGPVSIGKKPETSYPGLRSQLVLSSFAYASGPRGASVGTRSKSAPRRPGSGMMAMSFNRVASSGFKSTRPQRRPTLISGGSRRGGSRTTTTDYPFTSTTTPAPTTTLGFCKMVMFDKTYLRGQPVEITGDERDFNDFSFDNEIASLKIEGDCCWTLFADSNFQGASIQLNVGEYQSATDIKRVFKKASSARASC